MKWRGQSRPNLWTAEKLCGRKQLAAGLTELGASRGTETREMCASGADALGERLPPFIEGRILNLC